MWQTLLDATSSRMVIKLRVSSVFYVEGLPFQHMSIKTQSQEDLCAEFSHTYKRKAFGLLQILNLSADHGS